MSTDQINNPISDINSRVEGDAGGSIIITGAAGFIGSCMVQYLNENGYEKLIFWRGREKKKLGVENIYRRG